MKISQLRILLYIALVFTVSGCANIVPPSGGKKDVTPPKLVSISPADSLLNTRVTKIDLRFNEFLNLNNALSEVQVSPLLRMPISVVNIGRRVTVSIPDSLLRDSTTYRVSFGRAIGDLHENNIFANYVYTFSTTSYFDSLKLGGRVFNASTGLPDTGTKVLLYSSGVSDSAVVRERPEYVATTNGPGNFVLAGLPHRSFRIYALKDKNNNLIYDGGEEQIAFIDSIVVPVDSFADPIVLRLFSEPVLDTAPIDTSATLGKRISAARSRNNQEGFFYSVAVDTSDRRKRTVDITKPVFITFNKPVDSFNVSRIFLTYDSSDIDIETEFTVDFDTVHEEVLLLNSAWKENTLYTLRLLKGFAKDTAMTDAMPSKFVFRTKSDDDYGKLNIHLPAKYDSTLYILMVQTGNDTVYNKPVTDTMVKLTRLQPGNYSLRIIVDRNGNGVWDTGDLFAKLQPELVIPYQTIINLKPGWENTIDFEPVPKTDKNSTNRNSPGKRDSSRR